MNIKCINSDAFTLSQIKVGGFFECDSVLHVKCRGIPNDGCFPCLVIGSQTLVLLRGSSIVVPATIVNIEYKV